MSNTCSAQVDLLMEEVYRWTCSDLPCVDVAVGWIHHPLCSIGYPDQYDDLDEIFGPMTPEEEETLPEDTDAEAAGYARAETVSPVAVF